ncbi:hypothetical protein J22TS3_07220 [Paenibacillus sp. J22TS3]|nr:hypothetical protein J22TS3_07220 [Paenibacillus sp. J22TS3]
MMRWLRKQPAGQKPEVESEPSFNPNPDPAANNRDVNESMRDLEIPDSHQSLQAEHDGPGAEARLDSEASKEHEIMDEGIAEAGSESVPLTEPSVEATMNASSADSFEEAPPEGLSDDVPASAGTLEEAITESQAASPLEGELVEVQTSNSSEDGFADPAAQVEEMDEPGSQEKIGLISPSEPILEVREVHRSFPVGGQSLHVLKGINMEVMPGQLVMLKGRSGSGKTTLLNMLGGLDQPSQGEIYFRGQKLHTLSDKKRTVLRRDQIGFIFQAYALLPLLSAYENVELSLRMASVPSREWKERITHCLNLVGLGKRMHHRPFELSGGEQQRVAIAKAIAHRPHLLLADEPTANLDSQMGAQVMAVFKNIIETENVTICMTTHDPTILEVADHVYEMVDGRFV